MNDRTDLLLIEPHYLPCINYYSLLAKFETVIIDISDRYEKQSYRNRCRINGANKVENLIIPVKYGNRKLPITNMEIDHGQKWMNNHLRAIQSAYGKSPFYEHYFEEIFDIFNKRHLLLHELTVALLTKCLELLELQINIELAGNFKTFTTSTAYNAKNVIHPKKQLPNELLFTPQNYLQVFGKNFVPNLSVIDVLFCSGPQAKQLVRQSIVYRPAKFDK